MSSFIQFRYSPYLELNRLFDNTFQAHSWSFLAEGSQNAVSQRLHSFRPKLDLHESEDSNVVTATFELPGLKPEDVAIDVHENRLIVSGESTSSSQFEEDDGHGICERSYRKLSRTLQLPLGTKAEDVKAKMDNGLLTLTFPKATEQQPQRIAIQ